MTFIDYLKQQHMLDNPELLDDDLPDAFDNWLSTMEQDVLIQHAEDMVKQCYRKITELKEEIHNLSNK